MYQLSIFKTTTVVAVLSVIPVETSASGKVKYVDALKSQPPLTTTIANMMEAPKTTLDAMQTELDDWRQQISPAGHARFQEVANALKEHSIWADQIGKVTEIDALKEHNKWADQIGQVKEIDALKEHNKWADQIGKVKYVDAMIGQMTDAIEQQVHHHFEKRDTPTVSKYVSTEAEDAVVQDIINSTAGELNASRRMDVVANQNNTLMNATELIKKANVSEPIMEALNATEQKTEAYQLERAENVRQWEEEHRQFENDLWRDIYITPAIVPRLEATMETINTRYCQTYSPPSDIIELTCSAIQLGSDLIKTSKFIQAQLKNETDPHTVTVLQDLQKNLTSTTPITSGSAVVQTALIATDLIMNMMWLSPLFKNITALEREVPIYVAETVFMATTSQEPLATLMAGTAKWIHAFQTDPENFHVTYTGLADILHSLHEHEKTQDVTTDDHGVHQIDVSDFAANSEPFNNEYWVNTGHEIAQNYASEIVVQIGEKSPTPKNTLTPDSTTTLTRSPRVKRFTWWLYRQISARTMRRLRHWGGRARRVITNIRRSKAIRQTVAVFNRVRGYVTSSLAMLRDPYSPTRRNLARLSTSLGNTFQRFKNTWDTTFRRGNNREQTLEDAVNDYMQTPEFHRQMSIRFGAITNSEFEPIFNKLLDLATSHLEKILEHFVQKLVASFKKLMADTLKDVRNKLLRLVTEMTVSLTSQISERMELIKAAVHDETKRLMEITLDLAGKVSKAEGGSGWNPISAFFNFLSSAADLGGKVIESKMKYVKWFHGTTEKAVEKLIDGAISGGGAVLNKVKSKKKSRKNGKSDSESDHLLSNDEGGATGGGRSSSRGGNTKGNGRPKDNDDGSPSGTGTSGTSNGPDRTNVKKEVKKEDDLIDLETEAQPPGKTIIPSSKKSKAPSGPQDDDTPPLSPQPVGGSTRVVKKEDPIVSRERQHEVHVKTDPTRDNLAGNPTFPNPNDGGGATGGATGGRQRNDRTGQNDGATGGPAQGATGGPNTGNGNGANNVNPPPGFNNQQVIHPNNNPYLHDNEFVPDEYGLPRMVDSEGRMAVTPVHGETGLPVFRILRRGLEPNRFFYPDQDDFIGYSSGARRRPDQGPRRQDLGAPPEVPNLQRGQDRGPLPPLPEVPPRRTVRPRNRNNNNDENNPLGPLSGNAASHLDPHAPPFQPGSHSGSASPHSAPETAQLRLRHPSTVYADGVEYRHNGRHWVNHNGQMRPVDVTNTAPLRPDLHHYLGNSGPPNAISPEILQVFDSYLETQQRWFRVANSEAGYDTRYQNMLYRHSVELQRIFLENPALQTIQRHPPPGIPPQIWNDVIWGDFNRINPSISRDPNPYPREQRIALFRDHLEQMHRYLDHLTHHTRSPPDPRDQTGRMGRTDQQFRIAHQRIGGPVQELKAGYRHRWQVQPVHNKDPQAQQTNPYHSLYNGPQLRTTPLIIDPSVGSSHNSQQGRGNQSPNGQRRVLAENDPNRATAVRQDAPIQRSGTTHTETGTRPKSSSSATSRSGAANNNNNGKQKQKSKAASDPDVNSRSRSRKRTEKSDVRTSSLPEVLQRQPGESKGAYYARRGEALPDETLRASITDLLQPKPRKPTDLTMDLATISAVRQRRRTSSQNRGSQSGSASTGKSTPDVNNNVDGSIPIAGTKLGRFSAAKAWMEKKYATACPKESWLGTACRVAVNGGLTLAGIGISTVGIGAAGDAIMCQVRTECRMGPNAYEQMLLDERNQTMNGTLRSNQDNFDRLFDGLLNLTVSHEAVAKGQNDVVNVTTGQQIVINELASKSLDPGILENLKIHGYVDPTFMDRFLEKQVGALVAAHDVMKMQMGNATWTIERQKEEIAKLMQDKVVLLRALKKRKDSMTASEYHLFMSDTFARILLNKFPRQYITEDFMTAVYHSYIDEIHAIPEFEDYEVDDFIYLWNTTGFPFKNQRLVSTEETNSTFRITAPQLLKVGGKVYEKVESINDEPIVRSKNDSAIMFEDADGTVETYKENDFDVDYTEEARQAEEDYAEDYFGNIDDYENDDDAYGYVSPREKEQLPMAITQFVIQDSHDNYYDDKAHATKYLFIGLVGAVIGAVMFYIVLKRVLKAKKKALQTEWKEMQPLQRPPTYDELYYY